MYLYLGNTISYFFKNRSNFYCISTCCSPLANKMSSFKKRKFDPVGDIKPDLHYYDSFVNTITLTAQNGVAVGDQGILDPYPAVTQANIDGAGANTVWCINTIAQGSGQTQRVGSKYMIKSIQVTIPMQCSCDAMNAANTYAAMGWAIVLDKKPPKTTTMPPIGTVFKDTAELTLRAADLQLNMTERERFEILRTGIWIPKFNVSGTMGTATHIEDIFINNLNIPVVCQGTTPELAHIADGAIYVYAKGVGSTVPAAKATYRVAARWRIRFYDT